MSNYSKWLDLRNQAARPPEPGDPKIPATGTHEPMITISGLSFPQSEIDCSQCPPPAPRCPRPPNLQCLILGGAIASVLWGLGILFTWAPCTAIAPVPQVPATRYQGN